MIHAAACTSLVSVYEARRTNVVGTRVLAQQFCGARKLARFLYVSTGYRCGALEHAVVREDDASSPRHVVEYTRTKAEAEATLQAMSDLPLVIARPSIVVGHTRLGVGPSASLFWYYRALAQAPTHA